MMDATIKAARLTQHKPFLRPRIVGLENPGVRGSISPRMLGYDVGSRPGDPDW